MGRDMPTLYNLKIGGHQAAMATRSLKQIRLHRELGQHRASLST